MNDESDEERGILIRILANEDIQKGIAFFSIALILAFSAILPVPEEEVETGRVNTTDGEPEHEKIYYPGYRVRNATLELNISSIVEDHTATSRVSLLDYDFNTLYQENITSNESRSWEITEKDLPRDPTWIYFENISLNYTYTLKHESRPYSLLSIPAIIFTLVGMVFAFKGKGIILGEIKQKQIEEEARKKREERKKESEKDKRKNLTEEEIEEEVIYSGEDSMEESMEKKGDAEHINFMGVPDEDDEEGSEG
ncbi:MAG: hypothetical protein V5A88_04775 [Candidatus Thermoplasmatota archaeon]